MERLGLVARLEGELERIISSGLLPADGELPSEQTLAKRYGVSRSTAREALLRLSARGLVVQHPGRRTRAVALDEALTLENLGMVLHGEGSLSPERRLLLEGYLSLRREVTVELLSACCEHASEAELDRLGQACFALEDTARWGQERSQWVALEFELLRLAAAAARRPGHLLLIQSLERAFRAMAQRMLPCLDGQSVAAWARCAMHALGDRDAQVLRSHLPKLLEARDERVLAALAPTCAAEDRPEQLGKKTQPLELAQSAKAPSTPPYPLKVGQPCEASSIAPPPPRLWQPCEASGTVPQPPELRQPGNALSSAAQAPEVGRSAPGPMEAEASGPRCANLYGCRTGSCEVPPAAGDHAQRPDEEARDLMSRGPTAHAVSSRHLAQLSLTGRAGHTPLMP